MFCELHALAAESVFRTTIGPDLRSRRGSHVGSLYRPRIRQTMSSTLMLIVVPFEQLVFEQKFWRGCYVHMIRNKTSIQEKLVLKVVCMFIYYYY
jgi:hypothetical protein